MGVVASICACLRLASLDVEPDGGEILSCQSLIIPHCTSVANGMACNQLSVREGAFNLLSLYPWDRWGSTPSGASGRSARFCSFILRSPFHLGLVTQ